MKSICEIFTDAEVMQGRLEHPNLFYCEEYDWSAVYPYPGEGWSTCHTCMHRKDKTLYKEK